VSNGDPAEHGASSPTEATAAPSSSLQPMSQRSVWLIFAGALLALGIWILWHFLVALVWGAVIAIATWPFYERVAAALPQHVRGRIIAPLAFTLLVGIVFVTPLALFAFEAGREATAAVHWVLHAEREGLLMPDGLADLPLVGGYVSRWWQANLSDPTAAAELLRRLDRGLLIEWSRSLGSEVLGRLTVLAFTMLTLFFLYRDGVSLARQALSFADRIVGPAGERLGNQTVATVRGTFNGLVLVGVGEGVLLGFAYAWAGLSHPALLGAMSGILGMIPFGAPIMYGGGALVLAGQSQVAAAVALFAFGSAVTFVADHFIRPALIGGAVRLPFLWVLLGIFGGLESFGLLGLFLGPAVMAALLALWREWSAPAVR
jgi:predicted PurR-regulated permease PerM